MTARLVRVTDPAVHGEGSIIIGVTADGVSRPWQRIGGRWLAPDSHRHYSGVDDTVLRSAFTTLWAVYL